MRARMSSRLTLAAVGTSLLLAVTACGSPSKSASTVAGTSAQSPAATTPAATRPAGTTPSGAATPSGTDASGSASAGRTGGVRNAAAIQTATNAFTACLREQGLDVQDIIMGGGARNGGSAPSSSFPTRGDVPRGSFPGGSFPGRGNGGGGFNIVDTIVRQLGLDTSAAGVSAAVNACTPALQAAVPNFGGGGSTTTAAA